ncbi:PilZ domain-containing protein [Chitinivorax sp. PXF-14]|uniref:PilZ domain-containing protein n=1 Tax=Chitinivorax sp. PXF-14 TaxID=3230488 RepID=UPI00346779EE
MRQFIRHPVTIPFEINACQQADQADYDSHCSCDVSLGGLAFDSLSRLEPGAVVALRIPFVRPPFETTGRVAWCSPHGAGFKLGVAFLDPDDVFRARMVEQLCYIENYKQHVARTEQRELTSEEAAHEWIDKYAARFPRGGTH